LDDFELVLVGSTYQEDATESTVQARAIDCMGAARPIGWMGARLLEQLATVNTTG
jgi:hypothetical protein